MIREPPGGVEHFGVAGQLGMRDGQLEEVACVVHLVLQTQVLPSLVLLLHDVIRDEETVLLQRVQGVGNRHLVLRFQARTPESIAQLHLRVIHFFQSAHRRWIRRSGAESKVRRHRDGGKQAGG